MSAAVKPRHAKGAATARASAKTKGADQPSENAAVAAALKPPRAARTKKTIAAPGLFARRQIARLEGMLDGLTAKANDGESAAIDRILKILDRLDRYHGFSPQAASNAGSEEDARARILRKLSEVDARRAAARDEA